MSELKHGRYTIHLYTGGGLGGSYATFDEVNKPVKLYAMGPKVFDQQEWLFTHGDDQGKFRIFSTVNGTVLSTADPTAVPSGPVIAWVPPTLPPGSGIGPVIIEQNWVINPIKPGSDIYTIKPATKAVGKDYYLGHDGVDMHIQAFDPRDTSRKPQWQLHPCK